jgi:Uncharacterized conserved protein
VEIRRISTIEEYKKVEEIQRIAWGMEEECPVPVPILVAINNNGGLVEGAFIDGEMVGFTLGFPANKGNYRYFYSHMAGVLPDYRNYNVGYHLKIHQFQSAFSMGYSEVRWTFDPMKTRNAYFNTHKLGSFAYEYKINYYGIMGSKENKGIESDRIEAHKFKDKSPIRNYNFNIAAELHNSAEPWEKYSIDGDVLGFEVLEEIDQSNLELVKKWRYALRKVILELEGKNYVMIDVVRESPKAFLIFALKEKSGLI